MEKITIAKRNEMLREKALKGILDGSLQMLPVAGSKFAVDVELNGEFYCVRIDIVVPKFEAGQELSAVDMNEEYKLDQESKRLAQEEKAKAKEKKITRDKKTREEKHKEE